jgi:exoribonuclease R
MHRALQAVLQGRADHQQWVPALAQACRTIMSMSRRVLQADAMVLLFVASVLSLC